MPYDDDALPDGEDEDGSTKQGGQIRWDPCFREKSKHDAKMLLVILGDFPIIVVHSLGWCHIMINPCKHENWRLQKIGRKVRNIFWMKGLEICPTF